MSRVLQTSDRKKKHTDSKSPSTLRMRLVMVWGILIGFGLLLGGNLLRLQGWQGEILQQRATEQQLVQLQPFVPRRPIVDRQGNTMAIDRLAYVLYAHPILFGRNGASGEAATQALSEAETPAEQVARQLAPILERSPAELLAEFKTRKSGIRLEDTVSDTQARKIRSLQLDGLELVRRSVRLYPYQEIGSSVVGYVDIDRQGQAGIERSQEEVLMRSVPEVWYRRSSYGSLMPVVKADEVKGQVPGGFLYLDDWRLQLTVDVPLQRMVQRALAEQIESFQAQRGMALVMDVRDGSLLSLATHPSYNPNTYYEFDVSLFKNWAVTDLFEPGSTFKPINVAIALETGAVEPNSRFRDEGRITIEGYPISNYDYSQQGAPGVESVTEILKYSRNVGMVHVMEQLPRETYYNWLQKLGLSETVGIDLPFEISSYIKSKSQFVNSQVEAATTAFGQGFSLTAIKLAQLHAAIANGGTLVTPHVVAGLFDRQGNKYWEPSLGQSRRIFSQPTTRDVLAMMEEVVEDGTGQKAAIEGYRIAGKTGTAQKADPRGGYKENAIITSFVGMVPASNPRYLVLAVVDEPQGGSGGTTAAPIVKKILQTLIVRQGIQRQPPPGESGNIE
jgi:cell division protein FtsI (penicillin-binding protein 3)